MDVLVKFPILKLSLKFLIYEIAQILKLRYRDAEFRDSSLANFWGFVYWFNYLFSA